jgi:glycerol-1-phosphate dehydrogenase [NAD(P)+]
MNKNRQVSIPNLVRIKSQATERIGLYCQRYSFKKIILLKSAGLPPSIQDKLNQSFKDYSVEVAKEIEITDNSIELAQGLFTELPSSFDAIIGIGGGKALDIAKYLSFLTGKPYIACPTSLSNDGFCSPQSSLTVKGKRRSIQAAMPFGVVVDLDVCIEAPKILWLSGVGDLMAKHSAILDWKLAFHKNGTPIDDFSSLLSDATVFQFMGRPTYDIEGTKLLANALMLNGIAMEICGSSRPASGSEHLISHALDSISLKPSLHGLQVGVASYLVMLLHKADTKGINEVFTNTGFWEAIQAQQFKLSEWEDSLDLAPTLKENFFTILSVSGKIEEAKQLLQTDRILKTCFN